MVRCVSACHSNPGLRCGLLASRVILEVGGRLRWRSVASLTFGLLAVYLASNTATAHLEGLFLLALALGVQCAALTKVGTLTVYTCFMTGALTKFAKLLSEYWFACWDQFPCDSPDSAKKKLPEARLLASIWTTYLIGGLIGTLANHRWNIWAIVGPQLVAALVTIDLIGPISVLEEIE
jgi:uncharacterized membrane protein YoaK (UPF0700 family)